MFFPVLLILATIWTSSDGKKVQTIAEATEQIESRGESQK